MYAKHAAASVSTHLGSVSSFAGSEVKEIFTLQRGFEPYVLSALRPNKWATVTKLNGLYHCVKFWQILEKKRNLDSDIPPSTNKYVRAEINKFQNLKQINNQKCNYCVPPQ